MPKMVKTWIVIADGARARVLAARGPQQGLDLVLERRDHAPRTAELGSDRPGRSFESATSARHAYSAPDYHRERELVFLRELVRELAAEHKAGRFERLVVVAPPTALGDLRKALGPTLTGAITAEINKDLTKVALHDLPQHLRDVAPC